MNTSTGSYLRAKCLAANDYSKIYEAKDQHGNLAAVKVTRASASDTHSEVEAMMFLSEYPHKNVIAYVRPPTQNDSGSTVFQYLELCERDLLGGPGPSNEETRIFLQQAAAALAHCHSHGVFHFDVKPDNIFIKDGVVKVADFGSCILVKNKDADAADRSVSPTSPTSPMCCMSPSSGVKAIPPLQLPSLGTDSVLCRRGTAMYLPPECFAASYARGQDWHAYAYAGQRDVWSLAITMYAVYSGYMPWDDADGLDPHFTCWCKAYDRNDQAALKDILCVNGEVELCVGFLDLLIKMLHPAPVMRLTMAQVCDDPWLRK